MHVLTHRAALAGRRAKLRTGMPAALGAGALALLLAGLFALLSHQILANRGLTRTDNRLLHDVISIRSPILTVLAKGVTQLGTAVAYVVLAAAGVWFWRRTRSWILPLIALLWMGTGLLLRVVISRDIARARPPQALHLVGAHGLAFPSGHTATATIGLGLAALLLGVVMRRRRRVLLAVAALLALAVGVSRSYLGVHWPTDVLGGWLFGVAWVAFGAFLYQLRPAGVR